MERLTITETPAPTDVYAVLIEALAAELQRQDPGAQKQGGRIFLSAEFDLRGLAFAVVHTLSGTS